MIYLIIGSLLFLLSGCSCNTCTPGCCYETDLPIQCAYDQALCAGAVVDAGDCSCAWWEAFHDPQLESLMEEALSCNPGITFLESKVREAYGEVKVATSHLWPRLDYFTDFEFTQITRTGFFPQVPGFPFEFGLWTMQMNLYYDFDIWDKNKDRVEKFLGKERSAMLDYNWGGFILSLTVAENYFKWLLRAEQLELQCGIVRKHEALLQLAEKSLQHNLANASDVIAQRVNMERAQEDYNAIKQEMEMYEHALKALVGNFCTPLQKVPICINNFVPYKLPKNLTLDVVANRLDIQSQIWLIESARKDISIAEKQFYPDFDLTAFFGFSTIHFQKWFNSASTNWIIDPALHLPIFHGGELTGNLLIQKEKFVQEVADYNQMVLDAAQEVLDGFSLLKKGEANYCKMEQEISEIQKDIDLSNLRIKHNLEPRTLVLQKEIGQLTTQIRQKLAEEAIIGAVLTIVRSTGGGYDCFTCTSAY